jgi:nucleotide-binding universal stress UspA family protein
MRRALCLSFVVLLCSCTGPNPFLHGDAGDDVAEPGDGREPGDRDDESGDGELGDGDGDADPGDGDGDVIAEAGDLLPPLEFCGPLELEASEAFALTPTYAYAVADIDGQLGDEIVAYHQGEIVSLKANMPTLTEHPIPYGGIGDAVLLQADDDGNMDLLVTGTTASSGLHTFLGDGSGEFTYSGTRNFEFKLYRLNKAADASIDALIGWSGPVQGVGQQQVLVDPLADAPALMHPSGHEPVTGDVDGDGIDELGFMDWWSNRIEIWTRDGDGYAFAVALDCTVEGFSWLDQLVIADVNADGLDDVVCLDQTGEMVAVSLWTSQGGFGFSRLPSVGVVGADIGENGYSFGAVADLEGDGDPEFLFERTFLRLGEDGNFGCQEPLGLALDRSKPIRVGDLDGDGRDELVHADSAHMLKSYSVP